MPRKSTTAAPLHVALLDGLDVTSRKDGSVHSIRVGHKTVAEVCVGKKNTRMNLRTVVKAPKGLALGGKSKSWPGGGVVVTADNVTACRSCLDAVVQLAQRVTGAADVAADLAARKVVTRDVRKRVASAARSGVKVTAA
jgi:hypothetical protein